MLVLLKAGSWAVEIVRYRVGSFISPPGVSDAELFQVYFEKH